MMSYILRKQIHTDLSWVTRAGEMPVRYVSCSGSLVSKRYFAFPSKRHCHVSCFDLVAKERERGREIEREREKRERDRETERPTG